MGSKAGYILGAAIGAFVLFLCVLLGAIGGFAVVTFADHYIFNQENQ